MPPRFRGAREAGGGRIRAGVQGEEEGRREVVRAQEGRPFADFR